MGMGCGSTRGMAGGQPPGEEAGFSGKKRNCVLFSPWPALGRRSGGGQRRLPAPSRLAGSALPAPPPPASLGPAGDWPGQGCGLGGASPAEGPWAPWDVATRVLSPAPAPLAFCLSPLPERAWGHCCWGAQGQSARQRAGLPAAGYLPITAARGRWA